MISFCFSLLFVTFPSVLLAAPGVTSLRPRANIPASSHQLAQPQSTLNITPIIPTGDLSSLNNTLGNSAHVWPPSTPWPHSPKFLIRRHASEAGPLPDLDFELEFYGLGSPLPRGQTFVCNWILTNDLPHRIWPEARKEKKHEIWDIQYLARIGYQISFPFEREPSAYEWEVGLTAMRVFADISRERGCRTYTAYISYRSSATQQYQHILKMELRVRGEPDKPPHPWLHPPGFPHKVDIPHQPGPRESHLLFPEHQPQRILYGDNTENTVARGMIHQLIQRIEQFPPQQTYPQTEQYGAPQEPSKCIIFRKSNALKNRLVVRALRTLENVILDKGAMQCSIAIIQGEELVGVIKLEFPFFSP